MATLIRQLFRPDLPTVLLSMLWLAIIGAFLYVPSAPIEYLGGDAVIPAKVHAGGSIAVIRSFRVSKTDAYLVSRLMVKGDCSTACEILDLSTSELILKAGEYRNVKRDHIIPRRAGPGVWELAFTFHYHDILGRPRVLPLPPLSIEVVE